MAGLSKLQRRPGSLKAFFCLGSPGGVGAGGLPLKEEDVKLIKDNNTANVFQWMERRRRSGFFMPDDSNAAAAVSSPLFP